MIAVENIRKRYHKQDVLRDCSFTVQPGECVGIIGANGCGKTTLLSIMAGIQRQDGGVLSYYGEDTGHSSKAFEKYVGYVPQENPLILELSVMDNLRLWCRAHDNKEAMEHTLSNLGLQEVRRCRVSKLSGGMKRRLSIACAMVNTPPVLILDEPTAAVDLVCKSQIHSFLQTYKQQQGMIVMSTHEESELRICDKVFLVNHGMLQPVTRGDHLEELILQTVI